MKIAIFGDTGGHYNQLYNGLRAIGLDSDNVLPEDLTVIHVGDLVHKGPDSELIISFVNDIMKVNPGQWIQLVGNHEAQYLGGPVFWGDFIDEGAQKTLHRWWNTKKIRTAVAVRDYDHDEDLLVTHAGLAPNFWEAYCHNETHPAQVAAYINSWKIDLQFVPGAMLSGEPRGNGGPVWAHAIDEIYLPWLKTDQVPFSQVHGHTTAFWWSKGHWGATPKDIRKHFTLDKENNISTFNVNGKRIICVDPGFSRYTSIEAQPSLLFKGDIQVIGNR